MSGTLFVVATPIGNLEDLTFRALRTLREVDLIAAEDTRRTSKLLAHYEVRKSLVSLREHNEAKQGARLVTDLEAGKNIAFVTDAGTPGIADPGSRFVRLARQHQIKVVPIPGCSAIATALSASGVSADEFVFAGFAPAGARVNDWSKDLSNESRTIVFFDTPHSINKTIDVIGANLVDRHTVIWRELTKVHEESVEFASGSPETRVEPRGEFVVVIGPVESVRRQPNLDLAQAGAMGDMFDYLTNYSDIGESEALAFIASKYRLGMGEARKAIKKHRILVKQQKDASD